MQKCKKYKTKKNDNAKVDIYIIKIFKKACYSYKKKIIFKHKISRETERLILNIIYTHIVNKLLNRGNNIHD